MMSTVMDEGCILSSKLLSCRACLATDVKLLNIHHIRLTEAFTRITGIPASISDGLPQYLCVFCSAALRKSDLFRDKCLRAHHWLTRVPSIQLTTDYIRSIDRISHKLLLNLSIKKLDSTDYDETVPIHIKKEDDIDNIFLPEDLKLELEIKDNIDEPIDDFSDDNAEQIFVSTPVRVKKEKKVRKRKKGDTKEREKRQIKKRLSDNDYLPDFDFATFENTYRVDIVALTKEQQLEEIALRKSSDRFKFAAFKCAECGKGFQAEDAYNNHVVRHSPSAGAHACEICLVRFKRLSRRQEHQDLHRLKFLCKQCSFVSRNRYQAKKHYEWHTGKIHVCKHCGATFTKSSTYLSHVRLQHPAMNVSCDVCGETFVGKLGLMQHKSRAHNKVEPSKTESKCASCGAQFESLEALNRHTDFSIDGVCDTNMRPCLKCGESLSSEESLQSHIKQSHDTELFKCLECNKTFANSSSYDTHHQRVHLNVRWRKSRDKRKSRRLSVEPRRRDAMCEICGKSCESNAALVYHQRSHTGERPFKCSQCTKSFTMPQALLIHQLVHSDERPYMCSVCPKAFKQKVGLQLHSRVHTGERPYKCSMCESSFKQGPHLRTHVKLMHNVPSDKQRRPKRKTSFN